MQFVSLHDSFAPVNVARKHFLKRDHDRAEADLFGLQIFENAGEKTRLVGAVRFELTTPCAQGRCATRLRYAPTLSIIAIAPWLREFANRHHS